MIHHIIPNHTMPYDLCTNALKQNKTTDELMNKSDTLSALLFECQTTQTCSMN